MNIEKLRVPVDFTEDETVEAVAARLAERGLKLSPTFAGRIEAEPVDETYLQRRRREVKRAMGASLVCHPDYRISPRHSNNPDVYGPARQPYLNAIAKAAAADRARNKTYRAAQRIVAAIGA